MADSSNPHGRRSEATRSGLGRQERPGRETAHTLRLATGAVCISWASPLVRFAAQAGMGTTPIAMWRVLLGGAILALLAPARQVQLLLPARPASLAVLAGLTFAVDLFIWHKSIVVVGAGMATILASTQVLWMALLGRLLLKERLSAGLLVAAVFALLGVALLCGIGSDIALTSTYVAGVAAGLGTGLAYACYLLALRAAVKAMPPGRPDHTHAHAVLVWGSLAAGAALAMVACVAGAPMMPTNGRQLASVVGLALIAQVLGWLLISGSLPRVRVARAALLLIIQPVFATLWGTLLFGETLTALQAAGGALTLGSIYYGNVLAGRQAGEAASAQVRVPPPLRGGGSSN